MTKKITIVDDSNIYKLFNGNRAQLKAFQDQAEFIKTYTASFDKLIPDMSAFKQETVMFKEFQYKANFINSYSSNFEKSLPDMSIYKNMFEKINMYKLLEVAKIRSSYISDISESFKFFDTFSDNLSEIDWTNISPTKNDIEQAEILLKNNDFNYLNDEITREFSEKKGEKELSNVYLILIFVISIILCSLNYPIEISDDTIHSENISEKNILPIMQNLTDKLKNINLKSYFGKITNILFINELLKKYYPSELIDILKFLRKVTKKRLIVRKNKKIKSATIGTLQSTDIVKVIAKRRNWTRISYYDSKSEELKEGWVLTRYLKKIK